MPAIDPRVVQEIAGEVVLQFVLDGDLRASPSSIDLLASEVALAIRQSLLSEDPLRGPGPGPGEEGFDEEVGRHAALLQSRLGSAAGMVSLGKRVISVLRASPNVEQVRADDATLLWKLLTVIRLLSGTAAPSAASPALSGDSGPLPPGGGPASGGPAEARVSARPPPDRPPPEDLDRRKRRRGRN